MHMVIMSLSFLSNSINSRKVQMLLKFYHISVCLYKLTISGLASDKLKKKLNNSDIDIHASIQMPTEQSIVFLHYLLISVLCSFKIILVKVISCDLMT